MLKKFLGVVLPSDPDAKDAQVYRNVIRDAAKMGGALFGPTATGSRREFFCLDEHTWVWHEEWTDASNIRQARTTRYDVRPHGIFKAQDGVPYQPLNAEEAVRFQAAVHRYQEELHAKFDPALMAAA